MDVMDRFLRRKPVKPPKLPSPSEFTATTSYYSPHKGTPETSTGSYYVPSSYYENVAKDASGASAAATRSQTFRDLERTYSRRSSSISSPTVQANPVYEIPNDQTSSSQPELAPKAADEFPYHENEQSRMRRTSSSRTASYVGYSSESVASNSTYRPTNSRSASESAAPHALTTNFAESSVATAPSQHYNETSRRESRRHSRQQHEEDNRSMWDRRSISSRQDVPSTPISPKTSPNPSLRHNGFPENKSVTSLESQKELKPFQKERIQVVSRYDFDREEAVPPFQDYEKKPFNFEGGNNAVPTEEPQGINDDDDLSSICSDDSYVEKERMIYYERMVTEAVDVRDWRAAKEHAAKLKEILGLQKDQPSHLDLQTQTNYFLLCATIHYMLGELEDSLHWIRRIPQKKSTDPTILMSAFNMEAAISIRKDNLDEAFAISRRSGKYGRKFGLADATNAAHYLSQMICTRRGDTSEAKFYKQMITQADFKIPLFIEAIDPPKQEPEPPKMLRIPDDVYAMEDLASTPDLPPKANSSFSWSVLKTAGLELRTDKSSARARNDDPEYQGSTTNWRMAIKIAIDADADSDAALYLYRTFYINEIVKPGPPHITDRSRTYSPLENAILEDKTYAAIAIIQQKRAKLEDTNFATQPLQQAAARGNIPVLVALLQAGVKVHAVGTMNIETPLKIATAGLNYLAVRYLLLYGANQLSWSHGANALKLALEGDPSPVREKIIKAMLFYSRDLGDPDQIIGYLNEYEAKLRTNEGSSVLNTSNTNWQEHIIRLLSEYRQVWDDYRSAFAKVASNLNS